MLTNFSNSVRSSDFVNMSAKLSRDGTYSNFTMPLSTHSLTTCTLHSSATQYTFLSLADIYTVLWSIYGWFYRPPPMLQIKGECSRKNPNIVVNSSTQYGFDPQKFYYRKIILTRFYILHLACFWPLCTLIDPQKYSKYIQMSTRVFANSIYS